MPGNPPADGMPAMRPLATSRCALLPLLASHAETMFLVLSDPALYEFENAPPASVDALRSRYQRLEARQSPDGGQGWLNWVVQLPDGQLAGYVQATVLPGGLAWVAYEVASRHWRQGIGSAAVQAMLQALADAHGVHTAVAALKARNHRSAGLLQHLGFTPGLPPGAGLGPIDADEIAFHRPLQPGRGAGPPAPDASTTG